MMRFRSLRTALAVGFPLVALSVVTGKASAADGTPLDRLIGLED